MAAEIEPAPIIGGQSRRRRRFHRQVGGRGASRQRHQAQEPQEPQEPQGPYDNAQSPHRCPEPPMLAPTLAPLLPFRSRQQRDNGLIPMVPPTPPRLSSLNIIQSIPNIVARRAA